MSMHHRHTTQLYRRLAAITLSLLLTITLVPTLSIAEVQEEELQTESNSMQDLASTSLNDFALSATVTDAPVEDGAYFVEEGQEYLVAIRFASKEGLRLATEEELHYQLPTGFVASVAQPQLQSTVTFTNISEGSEVDSSYELEVPILATEINENELLMRLSNEGVAELEGFSFELCIAGTFEPEATEVCFADAEPTRVIVRRAEELKADPSDALIEESANDEQALEVLEPTADSASSIELVSQVASNSKDNKNDAIESSESKSTPKANATVQTVTTGSFTAKIKTAGTRKKMRFVPAVTGTYTLTSTGSADTYGYLKNSSGKVLASDDDGGSGSNFRITKKLEKGKTYYWEVRYFNINLTGSIKLSLARSVSTGTPSAVISVAGKRDRLRFVPTATGKYTLTSTGSKDTYGYLLDASGKVLASNDDGGSGKNFRISKTLSKGKTYYWEVCYFNINLKGTVKLRLSKGSSTTTNKTTYRALLIGEEDFGRETATRNRGDVKLMKKMLLSVKGPKGGSYTVKTGIDYSPARIRKAIRNTFADADSNDVSLFFIATHGDTDYDGRYAGALSTGENTSTGTLFESCVLFEELASWLSAVPGKVIVIVESCGSGAALYASGASQNQKLVETFQNADKDTGLYFANTGELRVKNKFYVLTASRYRESSWGTSDYNFFTKWLVNGVGTKGSIVCDGSYTSLNGSRRSGDGDGVAELEELFRYISAKGDSFLFNGKYYQHVQRYPVKSSYGLFKRK